MGMENFHWRSAVMSEANNARLIIRPGVLDSWMVVLKDGDFFMKGGEMVRCDGVARLRDTGSNAVRYTSIDGLRVGSFFAADSDRVEKLNLLGYSDIKRFLNGSQPEFIRDVERAVNDAIIQAEIKRPLTSKMLTSAAERERQRRANETPEQTAERRRKNAENMRRKRAMKKR